MTKLERLQERVEKLEKILKDDKFILLLCFLVRYRIVVLQKSKTYQN